MSALCSHFTLGVGVHSTQWLASVAALCVTRGLTMTQHTQWHNQGCAMRHIRMNITLLKTLLSVHLSNKSLVGLLCVALNADVVVTTGQSAAPGVARSRLLYAPAPHQAQG